MLGVMPEPIKGPKIREERASTHPAWCDTRNGLEPLERGVVTLGEVRRGRVRPGRENKRKKPEGRLQPDFHHNCGEEGSYWHAAPVNATQRPALAHVRLHVRLTPFSGSVN